MLDLNRCTTIWLQVVKHRDSFQSVCRECCFSEMKVRNGKNSSHTKSKSFRWMTSRAKSGHCCDATANFIDSTSICKRTMSQSKLLIFHRKRVSATWWVQPFRNQFSLSNVAEKQIIFQNAEFVEQRRQRLQVYLLSVLSLMPEVSRCNTRAQLEQVFPFFKQSHQVLWNSCLKRIVIT